jgi:hypothetical protein
MSKSEPYPVTLLRVETLLKDARLLIHLQINDPNKDLILAPINKAIDILRWMRKKEARR